jgi:CxxC motif-containing protein (DUF1111 family)
MTGTRALLVTLTCLFVAQAGVLGADFRASDPGVRPDYPSEPPSAGGPLPGLSDAQKTLFKAGKDAFTEVDSISSGLGPRFNLDSCAGCHAQPTIGGSSPTVNPQVAVATAFGALNAIPFFVTADGPVREARFKYNGDGSRDGGVHALFVISGRVDTSGNATTCTITQPDFQAQARTDNVIFRIPTPAYGTGLIEQIPDSVIVANQAANATGKMALGIAGRPHRIRMTGATNTNGNDGTIARFGWKAQNKSLLLFSGEAYNVEIGISNELFQTERDETPGCQFAPTPNDTTTADGTTAAGSLSDIEKFAFFMRVLAPPAPSLTHPGGAPSIAAGRILFESIGCAYCHTPTLSTGNAAVAALRNKPVNLYSDLLVHHMGPRLADDIVQAQAGPDEFRTAPLWGLGQRIFFLHDGRTSNLLAAIQAHKSAASERFPASEANAVVDLFKRLREDQKQDVLNFLRSL